MAVAARKPDKGTIHHSDHGGQFIGLLFGQACHDAGLAQSMGAVGTCYDNAVAETFFATLTKEMLLHDTPPGGWAARAELRSAIFEYIEGFYNPIRLHSTLGMRSPVEYEADHAAGDPDGLARHGRARKNCGQPSVAHRYYCNNNLTPRNRGRSTARLGSCLSFTAERASRTLSIDSRRGTALPRSRATSVSRHGRSKT